MFVEKGGKLIRSSFVIPLSHHMIPHQFFGKDGDIKEFLL